MIDLSTNERNEIINFLKSEFDYQRERLDDLTKRVINIESVMNAPKNIRDDIYKWMLIIMGAFIVVPKIIEFIRELIK